MRRSKRILIAGVGNIFLGDDAFGSEVARRLMQRALPPEVHVRDFGISVYDLAYAMMDGYDATILLDTTAQGQPPGTVYLIEPAFDELDKLASIVGNAHSMTPVNVLQMVRSLGGSPGKLYLVGCEPATLESDEGSMELSESVEAAVPRAIERIESLVMELLSVNQNAEI